MSEYRAVYETGKEALQAAEIEEAALDARLLLEYVCGTNRNTLLAHGDMDITKAQEEEYLALCGERGKHVPLQQITGQQDFMGLDFFVNENVLIPRQDTEILVEEVLRELHDGMSILDMCTGSGCILISLLHYANECKGVGVDLSEKALEVAKRNAEKLVSGKDISFVQSDLFEKVTGKYDLLVSNPPYIKSDVIETLMPEVRDFEPRMALDGDLDGLKFYRRIVQEGKEYLLRGGRMYFEIGYDQGPDVKKLMEENGFCEVSIVKDFAGLDRVVFGTFLEDTQ